MWQKVDLNTKGNTAVDNGGYDGSKNSLLGFGRCFDAQQTLLGNKAEAAQSALGEDASDLNAVAEFQGATSAAGNLFAARSGGIKLIKDIFEQIMRNAS
ncbi:hypothetical protein AAKU67_002738 [Oxalobacteraceae bacterium GrIS 2.11]